MLCFTPTTHHTTPKMDTPPSDAASPAAAAAASSSSLADKKVSREDLLKYVKLQQRKLKQRDERIAELEARVADHHGAAPHDRRSDAAPAAATEEDDRVQELQEENARMLSRLQGLASKFKATKAELDESKENARRLASTIEELKSGRDVVAKEQTEEAVDQALDAQAQHHRAQEAALVRRLAACSQIASLLCILHSRKSISVRVAFSAWRLHAAREGTQSALRELEKTAEAAQRDMTSSHEDKDKSDAQIRKLKVLLAKAHKQLQEQKRLAEAQVPRPPEGFSHRDIIARVRAVNKDDGVSDSKAADKSNGNDTGGASSGPWCLVGNQWVDESTVRKWLEDRGGGADEMVPYTDQITEAEVQRARLAAETHSAALEAELESANERLEQYKLKAQAALRRAQSESGAASQQLLEDERRVAEQAQSELARAMHEKDVLSRRLEEASAARDSAEALALSLQRELKETQDLLAPLRLRVSELESANSELEHRQEGMLSPQEVADLRASVKQHTQERDDYKEAHARLQERLNDVDADATAAHARARALDAEVGRLQRRLADLEHAAAQQTKFDAGTAASTLPAPPPQDASGVVGLEQESALIHQEDSLLDNRAGAAPAANTLKQSKASPAPPLRIDSRRSSLSSSVSGATEERGFRMGSAAMIRGLVDYASENGSRDAADSLTSPRGATGSRFFVQQFDRLKAQHQSERLRWQQEYSALADDLADASRENQLLLEQMRVVKEALREQERRIARQQGLGGVGLELPEISAMAPPSPGLIGLQSPEKKSDVRQGAASPTVLDVNVGDYLKNVIVKFMSTDDVSEKETLLPVIATILRFSPEETARVKHEMDRSFLRLQTQGWGDAVEWTRSWFGSGG